MIVVRLREIAEAQGYNLSRLQKASGVDMGVLRRYWYWDNSVQSIHVSTLLRLCRFLNVTPGDLLEFVSTEQLP